MAWLNSIAFAGSTTSFSFSVFLTARLLICMKVTTQSGESPDSTCMLPSSLLPSPSSLAPQTNAVLLILSVSSGTGSSAIYPLLACRQRPQWRFLATEIDEKSRAYAQKNVAMNQLQSRIKLIDTDPEGRRLIPSAEIERFDRYVKAAQDLAATLSNVTSRLSTRIDILMTNPPFYANRTSLLESASVKSRPPNSSCTGADIEMITPGGEVAFVTKLVDESMQESIRRTIQWFSAMLGKLSSVGEVVEQLRKKGCVNHVVAEFVQGQKTRRWCVAWSWMGFRPSNAVARGVGSGVERRLLPASTEVELPDAMTVDGSGDADAVAQRVSDEIDELDLMWRFDSRNRVGLLVSRRGDVWSRKARRKNHKNERRTGPLSARKKNKAKDKDDEDEEMKDPDQPAAAEDDEDSSEDYDSEDDPEAEPGFVARISILSPTTPTPNSSSIADDGSPHRSGATVHIRHLQGTDVVVFESFAGWLKRKVCMPRPRSGPGPGPRSDPDPRHGDGHGAGRAHPGKRRPPR